MTLLLTPILEALDVARVAAADAIHGDDDVTVEDQGEQWVFEFIPAEDTMGGGARVAVAKDDLRVLKVIRGQ